jgi:hypothetical protein
MPWPFRETSNERVEREFLKRLFREEQALTGPQRHIVRYRHDCEVARIQREMHEVMTRELREEINNERAQREAAGVRTAMALNDPPAGAEGEDLPPYRGPSSDFVFQHARQQSLLRQNMPPQIAYQSHSSQQTLTEEPKQQSSYQPLGDRETPHQTHLQQHPLNQSIGSYHHSSAARQGHTTQAPIFRQGWDQRPSPGISRPPTYNTSEREHSGQSWWRGG